MASARPHARRMRRARRRNATGDLVARIAVALPAIVVAIIAVSAGGWVFAGALIVLGVICTHELSEMFANANPARFAGIVGIVALLVVAQTSGATHAPRPDDVLETLVFTLPLVFIVGALQPRSAGAPGISVTMLGLVWIGLAFAHGVMLERLAHGPGIVVDVLVGTFIGDTAAYLGGRAFGHRRLAPKISPNKTVEGLIIGMVVCVVAVWFAHLYQSKWLSGEHALMLGVAVAVAAPLGDLFESYLKRDAGTKDTGRLFGVHGGALDRLDAAMFAIVAGYYVAVGVLPGY
jgi:phosphatidate cytidylyltransferase